jgi:hypothetical protein
MFCEIDILNYTRESHRYHIKGFKGIKICINLFLTYFQPILQKNVMLSEFQKID